jgi:HK97 family phage major capsid protein
MSVRFDQILEMRKNRKKLWEEARSYRNEREKESADGKLSSEDARTYQAKLEDVQKLTTQIETEERELEIEEKMVEAEARRKEISPDGSLEKQREDYRAAFVQYIRNGMSSLTDEQRSLVMSNQRQLNGEERALAVGTDTAGGFTVPAEMWEGIVEGMKMFGGIRNTRATIINSSDGRDMPIPTGNDTSNVGELLGENSPATEQDPTFGSKNLIGYTFSSKMIRVPFQLLEDSVINIEQYLNRLIAERIGRASNSYFVNGTGTAQPEGVVTGSVEGKAANATAAITYDELVDLIHSVDPAYRANAEFMFHDDTLKALKKLKDSQNRPLWTPGIALREPDTINGYRYVIDNDMPTMAASEKAIVFGDMSHVWIRDVQGGLMLRLVERYADYGQVAFLAFTRHGSVVVNAGTGPVKHLVMSAT